MNAMLAKIAMLSKLSTDSPIVQKNHKMLDAPPQELENPQNSQKPQSPLLYRLPPVIYNRPWRSAAASPARPAPERTRLASMPGCVRDNSEIQTLGACLSIRATHPQAAGGTRGLDATGCSGENLWRGPTGWLRYAHVTVSPPSGSRCRPREERTARSSRPLPP